MTVDRQLLKDQIDEARSTFELILRGHLCIEAVLIASIEARLERPHAVEIDRAPFARKLDLALALGALDQEEYKALKELNKVRNSLAHDLGSTPSVADVDRLVDALDAPLRRPYEAYMQARIESDDYDIDADPDLYRLQGWLSVVAMVMDYRQERTRYERQNQLGLMQVAAAGLAHQHQGREFDEAAARRQFGVPPPPQPGAGWRSESEPEAE